MDRPAPARRTAYATNRVMTGSQSDLDVVDLGAVARWMDGAGLGSGPISDAVQLGGGTQNILIRFTRSGRGYVLRRGPRHLRPHSNDQLLREIQVLGALAATAVPHPRLIAACADTEVLSGAVFYLMEPVEGFNPSVQLPALHASDAAIRYRMGLAIAEGAAVLGAVDHVAVGLDGVGKPEGFLQRQVGRWLSELESYARFDGYPGPQIPGVGAVAGWLEANLPPPAAPGIVHGDYHLANVMYRYDSPELAAIVDWEMCTIGDPLLDLGWLLATWPAQGSGVGGLLGTAGGLPAPAELVAHYARHSTRELSAVDWYAVLACFKLGIVLEGTHARAFAGKAPVDVGDALHATTLTLFERARRIAAV